MISFSRIIDKASWGHFAIWFAISAAYNWWAFRPGGIWPRVVENAGGVVPEMKPGIPAIEPVRSLDAMGENTGDYLLWQLLDIPYAFLNVMIVTIAIGLGLKALKLGATPLRFLLALPFIYFVSEIVENALVAGFASGSLPVSEPVVLVQQLATTLKFASGVPGMFLALLSLAIAAIAGLIRLVRK
ncbi:hypothetical protein PUV54_03805 [Hyphococcus flavus]|uniref:Uncharacterized protein n=1 Tax=Hyphococcus flavus TaxID=1866326 RepID=A0AAE9ZJL6_9PROT|nr:hypothetical protein [Hyphococcus flavus]WDI32316.1 hypothetical protein PUV54_03805 [Hyphococcus flavus]